MSKTQIKICGLSTPDTLAAAVAAGVSHVGFVHFPNSPRHLALKDAAKLRPQVPDHVQSVLLVVDLTLQAVLEAIAEVKPDIIQLHGSETPDYTAALRQSLGAGSTTAIWKAIGVKDPASLAQAIAYKGAADLLLYDAPARALPGGNGLAMDWSLLANYRHEMPWGLAGGLTADNVAEAIRQTRAPLVDTSSGVESAPGIKDAEKITAFCRAIAA